METEQKIQQLQLSEQGLQNLLMQKQQLQMQVVEFESALNELEGNKQAYRIVGNIMIEKEGAELQKEITEKKETVELRLKTLNTQEQNMREKTDALQKEVMEELKQKNGTSQ